MTAVRVIGETNGFALITKQSNSPAMQALTFASNSLGSVPASPLSRTKATATFDVRCSCRRSLQLGVIQHSGALPTFGSIEGQTKWWLSSPLLASSSV